MRIQVTADQRGGPRRFRVTVLLCAGQIKQKISLDKCLWRRVEKGDILIDEAWKEAGEIGSHEVIWKKYENNTPWLDFIFKPISCSGGILAIHCATVSKSV